MKMQEIRQLDDADLLEQIRNLKKKYEQLKILHKVQPLENPLELRELRRTIARLLTEKNARGLK
ncbi:MAG: 50S ribosomal protein L29 [Chlorobi bacterium]|nr:50S ribosomal protein L29 [Chlorobiota bacterium]